MNYMNSRQNCFTEKRNPNLQVLQRILEIRYFDQKRKKKQLNFGNRD